MKFRKTVDLTEMLWHPTFLPKMQVGQAVAVNGEKGRFVGVTKAGTIWIVWPNTVGPKNVSSAIKTMNQALRKRS